VVRASSEVAVAQAAITLPDTVDLHARPAADFVRTAMRFGADVRVAAGEREADGKSLLSILALGAKRGTTLRLRAEGPDAVAAIDALAATVGAFDA
jgi:phosphotransferase system HPr (HPr) family protein